MERRARALAGPLYQGRFKSFPIQDDDHLWTVLRYVERNPLRANLVEAVEQWRWSSLWHRVHGDQRGLVDDGPLALPHRWLQHVPTPPAEGELEACARQSRAAVRHVGSWRPGTGVGAPHRPTVREVGSSYPLRRGRLT